MNIHDFEITIGRDGKVTVHMKGVKGPSCMEYAKWLAEILGTTPQAQKTSEFYEPDGSVRIDVERKAGR